MEILNPNLKEILRALQSEEPTDRELWILEGAGINPSISVTAPAVNPQSKYNCQKQNFLMETRVGFKSDDTRKKFFRELRSALNVNSWRQVAEYFCLRRTKFQEYQYGKYLMSSSLFEKMVLNLPEERREYFQKQLVSKPQHWGRSKGGKALFKKYPKEMKRRRLNGLKKLKKMGFSAAIKIDDSQPLSKKLCEFVGTYIGDGFVSNGNTIGISGDSFLDKEYYAFISQNIKELFGLEGHIVKSKKRNSIYLKFYSINLCRMFFKRFNFPDGEKTYVVQIPEEILREKEELIFSTIRGIYDTDGCIFFDRRPIYNKPYPRITLDMKSKPLIDQLQPILSKHFTVRRGGNKKRNDHTLEIYGHKQFEKWMKLIGFSNKRHLDRIAKADGGI